MHKRFPQINSIFFNFIENFLKSITEFLNSIPISSIPSKISSNPIQMPQLLKKPLESSWAPTMPPQQIRRSSRKKRKYRDINIRKYRDIRKYWNIRKYGNIQHEHDICAEEKRVYLGLDRFYVKYLQIWLIPMRQFISEAVYPRLEIFVV